MEVVEPEMRDPTIAAGAFVFLSIDPVASVADMQDEKATAAAARLRRGAALVMVRRYDIDGLKPFYTQPLAFDFLCIGHGLPAEPPYACIGLSPEAVHPNARPPVLPSVPMPWSDCYVHLFEECGSIVTRIHLEANGRISRIPEDEILRVITAKFDDHAQYGEEVGSKADSSYGDGSLADFEIQSAVVVPVSDGDKVSATRRRTSGASTADSSSTASTHVSASPSSKPSIAAVPTHEPQDSGAVSNRGSTSPRAISSTSRASAAGSAGSSQGSADSSSLGDIQRLRYRGEVWLDLTAFDDFEPPEFVANLIASLEEIENEWANRMALKLLADQPATAQWATDVAAAGSSDALAVPEPVVGEAPDDEDILPEDAIEHRLAKASQEKSISADDVRAGGQGLPPEPAVQPSTPIVPLADAAVLPVEPDVLPGQPPATSPTIPAVSPATPLTSRKQNGRERLKAVALDHVKGFKFSFKSVKRSLAALLKTARAKIYVPTPKSLL